MDSLTVTDPFPELPEDDEEDPEAMEPHCEVHCVHYVCMTRTKKLSHDAFKVVPCQCKNKKDLADWPGRPELCLENCESKDILSCNFQVQAWKHIRQDEGLQIFQEESENIVKYVAKVTEEIAHGDEKFLGLLEAKYPSKSGEIASRANELLVGKFELFFSRRFRDRKHLKIYIETLHKSLRNMVRDVITHWAIETYDDAFKGLIKKRDRCPPKRDGGADEALFYFWLAYVDRLVAVLAWRNDQIIKYQQKSKRKVSSE
ncbi:hypothetical protein IQ07DRAFT_652747 [Pyrenochaeta sp. DS3sAY3a]|nr:hypothetical protein IQ07DRAFT_652747 [Pyrenochaeta sp. DS3sAY3a]